MTPHTHFGEIFFFILVSMVEDMHGLESVLQTHLSKYNVFVCLFDVSFSMEFGCENTVVPLFFCALFFLQHVDMDG